MVLSSYLDPTSATQNIPTTVIHDSPANPTTVIYDSPKLERPQQFVTHPCVAYDSTHHQHITEPNRVAY